MGHGFALSRGHRSIWFSLVPWGIIVPRFLPQGSYSLQIDVSRENYDLTTISDVGLR